MDMTNPIEAVLFKTQERANGTSYEVARIWMGGVPFSADLSPHVERIARRLAAEAGVDVGDHRSSLRVLTT